MWRAATACVMGIALAGGSWAQDDRDGLVAWYPADEGQGAVLHDVVGGQSGRVRGGLWVRAGQAVALDFDGLGSEVDCGDPVPLRLAEGPLTLALWLRTNARVQQYLITRYGWSLYLDAAGVPHFEARSADNSAWQDLPGSGPVALDEWAHLAGVYDRAAGEWRLYLNGARIAAAPREGGFGGIFRSKLALGSWAWSQAHFLNGLAADIRIYSRALGDEQVAALHRAGSARFTPELRSPRRRFSLRLRPLPTAGKLVVDLGFRNLGEPIADAGAVVELVRPGAAPLLTARTGLDEVGRGRSELSTAGLPAGSWTLRATLTEAGKPVRDVTSSAAWTKSAERPWWLGTKEGRTDAVPQPWTALVATGSGSGRTVKCWNREYAFRGNAFPASIKSAARELLAGPVRLRLRTDRGEETWQAGALKPTAQSPAQVVLEATGPAAGMRLSGRTTVEYDGMLRVDWALAPQAARELRELVCEVPLPAEVARYWYYYPDRSGSWEAHRPGSLPAAGVAIPFNPTIWLGDEDRGLQWFTEHDADWLPSDPKQAVTIRREGDQVVLALHLIGRPVRLDPSSKATSPGGKAPVGRLAYTFGFQATPVKPLARDAWDYRSSTLFTPVYPAADPGPDGKSELDRLAASGVRTLSLMDWTGILCHNLPTEPDKLRHFVDECHQRGIQVLIYFGFQVSDAAPEFAEWIDQAANWNEARPFSYESGLDNYPPKPAQTVYRVCYQSAWADFVVAGAARCMDEYGVDGVYLDGTGCPLPCYNPYHGCGPVAGDGNAHARTTFFATRDMMRRLYVAIRQRNPNGQVNLHNSAFLAMPSVSFATSCWDGEQLSTTLGREMPDRMPLDYFRTEFMGRQWGIAQEFLDYILPYPYRTEWGLTLLHDVPVRPYMKEEQLVLASSLWRLMDEFGRKQAEWLPYWSNGAYVRAEPAGVYVSLYRHPRHGVLAVIDNYSSRPATATVTLQTASLVFYFTSFLADRFITSDDHSSKQRSSAMKAGRSTLVSTLTNAQLCGFLLCLCEQLKRYYDL
ncbi:MAG: hypothetical protein HYU66_21015, partial [Armatimonadetes bacterium]|nr:hypothetical protein [Armatimonadota bacterium]